MWNRRHKHYSKILAFAYMWAGLLVFAAALLVLGGAPAVAQSTSANTESEQNTPEQSTPQQLAQQLAIAVANSQVDTIVAMFNKGVRIDALGEHGESLIGFAAANSSSDTIKALLFMGANLEWRDAQGYTPLLLALKAAQVENANTLKKLGAKLSAVADDGYNAAALAEIIGAPGFDESHIRASTFSMSQEEATQVLLLASELGDRKNVEVALEQGADVYAEAANGWTPIMLASLGAHAEIVQLLAQAMPDSYKGIEVRSGEDKPLFDVVQAALVGEGNGQHQRVGATLDALREAIFNGKFRDERVPTYRANAQNIGYDKSFISRYLPGLETAFLPALEYDLPMDMPADKDGWMAVQRVLKAEGLYDGAIDGKLGQGTLSALLAYVMPMEALMAERGEQAARLAQTQQDAESGYRIGRLVNGEMVGEKTVGYYVLKGFHKPEQGYFTYLYSHNGFKDGANNTSSLMQFPDKSLKRVFSLPLLDKKLVVVRAANTTTVQIEEREGESKKPLHRLQIAQKKQAS